MQKKKKTKIYKIKRKYEMPLLIPLKDFLLKIFLKKWKIFMLTSIEKVFIDAKGEKNLTYMKLKENMKYHF